MAQPQENSRKDTRPVKVGTVMVGGGFPISVQTMWKSPVQVNAGTIARINGMSDLGCDILRFAVPHLATANIVGELSGRVRLPIVADIHFDHRIALKCMDWPIAKIRINPGNIGAAWKVAEVVRKAIDRAVPIRIGVNSGSLPKNLRGEKNLAQAMVKAAETELEILDKLGLSDVIVSLKSSDIETNYTANILFSEKYDYPLHIGLTEAGPLIPGLVKSTAALYSLLKQGIGDTIRISLSDSPENEITAGCELLKACGLKSDGIRIISCPTCGRAKFDVQGFIKQAYPFLLEEKENLRVAVMGCEVNGPGEAAHADICITGNAKYAVIFKRGVKVRRVPVAKAFEALKEEIANAE